MQPCKEQSASEIHNKSSGYCREKKKGSNNGSVAESTRGSRFFIVDQTLSYVSYKKVWEFLVGWMLPGGYESTHQRPYHVFLLCI